MELKASHARQVQYHKAAAPSPIFFFFGGDTGV
jgi:hypothetical protein